MTAACARGDKGDPGPVIKIPPTIPNGIEVLASEYNDSRVAKGQDPVTEGLTCTLYSVPNTTTQIVGAALSTVGSWTFEGTFNDPNGSSAPGLNIMPPVLRPVYTSYYVIKCSGLLAVVEGGFYSFELSSDDGANLSVNGALINNDGTHAITTKTAVKYLDRGMVSFQLDYLDIGGSHALVLNSSGIPIGAKYFYH